MKSQPMSERRMGLGALTDLIAPERVIGIPVGEPIELPGRLRALVGGDQAQVPGGSRDSVVAVQYPEHRDAGGLQRRDHLVRMTLGAGLVQDHPRDAGPAVVRRHAVHDRRDRPRRR